MEGKKVKIGTSLSPEDAVKLIEVLKVNISAFAWHAKDMPGVDPDFMCHRLAIDPSAKPVIQKRRKFGEEKRKAIAKETNKLLMAGHVREIQYPTWLANVVMVRKSSGKWRMCTDFTDLNKACLKDSYPLPNIDCLFTLNHVPREQNLRANLLSKLASTKKPGATRSVIQETLAQPSINEPQGVFFSSKKWIGPYIAYLTQGELPEDKRERKSARFVVINERLYRRGFSSPLLRCLTTSQAQRVMDEVHSGMCGSHIGGRALVYKVARAGYFWPSLRNDCVNWVQKCDGYNGTQFTSARVREFCRGIGIRMTFTSVEYPQSNGQAESANKVILSGLKKRVQDSGASWVEELPRVLWSYHTTVHSSTQDTPFNLVYGTDAMIPIEIAEPSVRATAFSEEESDQGRRVDLDLITETRERARINQVAAQRRTTFKYNTKVVPRDFVVGDLVLKRAQLTQMRNKLSPK
uniref:Retrotransposable element Tf2 n=1 Tax=Cajanus cajan TaxID=3821 RepID=A0A151RXR9_CAJCA|nr:Retrotransposable element Tf2 [Cajanus cajan]